MREQPQYSRRRVVRAGLVIGGFSALAGCSDSAKPARVTDTRVAYDDHRVGVFVSLTDANPNEAGPIMIHAELLAGETVIAEREKSVQHPPEGGGNYVIWFEDLSESDRGRVDGARASVTG